MRIVGSSPTGSISMKTFKAIKDFLMLFVILFFVLPILVLDFLRSKEMLPWQDNWKEAQRKEAERRKDYQEMKK